MFGAEGRLLNSRGNYNNITIDVGRCQEGAVVLLDEPGGTLGMPCDAARGAFTDSAADLSDGRRSF